MNNPKQARPKHAGARLTRIGVTIGLVLASMGAAITTAAPAHASVTEVAVAGAGPRQSATASCANGEFLSGAGGGITGGGSDVTLTDIIPDLANRSVTVWGHTNSAAVPAYTVVAQAICVPGPAPANYQLVSNTTGSIVDDHKAVIATCPGTRVLGTGYQIKQAFGQAFPRWNYPNVPLTNNTVLADAMGALVGNPWELIAYAICGTPSGAAPVRTANASAADSANSKQETSADCPASTPVTTGVGAATTPIAPAALGGFVFVNEISTNLAQEHANARAIEGVNLGPGDAWYAVAANICWDF